MFEGVNLDEEQTNHMNPFQVSLVWFVCSTSYCIIHNLIKKTTIPYIFDAFKKNSFS